MMEAGIVNRYKLLWQTPKPMCFMGASLLRVGLEQSSPAFIILFSGIVTAVILLTIELFWHKYQHVSFKMQLVINILHRLFHK